MTRDGDTAPEFTLPMVTPDGEQSEFTLSEALDDGPVVLAFFPLAFSSVCTTQVADIQENWHDELRDLDASVYGVSVDSPFALAEFAEQEGLSYPLLSDFEREVVEAYDMKTDVAGLEGVARRGVFLVDADGTVAYADVLEDASEIPEMAPVRDALAALD
ncbi:redoxin domain-containing protein [Halobacteriales archaeon Cl-PHB]